MNNASFLALVLALGIAGCERQEQAQRAAAAPGAPETAEAEGAAEPLAHRESIYQLAVPLIDQDSQAIGLDVARGHPVVVAMFYGTCRSTCPLLVRDVKALEAQLSPAERSDLRVLLVSFDADRDTPAALQQLSEKHGVDATRWRFAAAVEPGARSLAAVLGVQYRHLPDGEFSHNAVIALLDREGAIAVRSEGLGQPTKLLVGRLRSMPAGLGVDTSPPRNP